MFGAMGDVLADEAWRPSLKPQVTTARLPACRAPGVEQGDAGAVELTVMGAPRPVPGAAFIGIAADVAQPLAARAATGAPG